MSDTEDTSTTPYENLDIGYFEWPLPTTEEFQSVRFLNKEGVASLWRKINDKFMKPPSGGTTGQALVKTDDGFVWGDVVSDIPDVIPVSQGGTGCTTVEAIRTLLFNFPTDSEIDEYIDLESLGGTS